MRLCWIDLETITASHSKYPNVVSLAYWPEVRMGEPCPHGPRLLHIQPVVHMDDRLYGNTPLDDVMAYFNQALKPDDPDVLLPCILREGTAPVFAFSRSALTNGLPPPAKRNPSDWLLDRTKLSPKQALDSLADDLQAIPWETGEHRRWTFASFYGAFVQATIFAWLERILGPVEAKIYATMFNGFYSLDVQALVRWSVYAKALTASQISLKAIASSLGIAYNQAPEHKTIEDLKTTQQVVNILLSGVLYGDRHQGQRIPSGKVSSQDFA